MPQLTYPATTLFREVTSQKKEIYYPECDGKRMADNTLQFHWLVTIKENLELLFKNQPDVFVAGDLLWYPVEGQPKIRYAPDVLVVFGRPKGHRGSYLQWKEENVPVQIVFEILSPGNRRQEMEQKFAFYEQYGVEEYYIYNPQRHKLQVWLRQQGQLRELGQLNTWVSPRLGIRFELVGTELQVYHPTGEQFYSYVELAEQRYREQAVSEAELIFAESRIESAETRAEQEWQRAEQERHDKEMAQQRMALLEAKLRELGLDPTKI